MSKKNKKKKHKITIKIRQKKQSKLSKVLNSSKNEWAIKASYFNKLSPNEICNNISNIANHPIFKTAVNLSLLNNYKFFYSVLTPNAELIKVLNWSTGLIIYHKQIIKQFIIIEDQLTKTILDSHYDKSISLLNELDTICGLSTWSIAIRGTIQKLANQHNDSQDFLKNIIDKCYDNNFFKYICNSMINRYDDSSMILSSFASLKYQLLRNYQGDFQTFLIYKIIPKDFSFEYNINYADVLNYEKNASIIDLFKAIINFLSDTLNSKNPNDIECAKIAAVNLSKHFNYYILDNLSTYYGVDQKWGHNESDYDLIDAYSVGNYLEVCKMVKQNPFGYDNFTVFELIARSAARTDENPFDGFKNDILTNLVNIFIKQENYQKSLSYLNTLCFAFPDLPWFQELHFLIQRESHYIDESINTHLITLSSAFSKVNSPRKALTLPIEYQDVYLKSCNNSIKHSVSIKLYEIIKDGNIEQFDDFLLTKLENNRFAKYKAKLLLKKGLIDEAIQLLEELSNSSDIIVAHDSIQLLVESYIDNGQDEKAIALFANTSLINTNLIRRFNTYRICDVAQKNVNVSKSICIPIALSLHSMYIDSKYDSVLRYSFEKFLNNNGATNPLEIINLCSNISERQLYYFFEHVCTQNVMKLSFLFDNKKEIEDCRIAVCTFLIDKNISKTNLVNEVKEITKDQLIKKAVKHVDQSRIYADLSGFRDSRSQPFRDGFEYYVELNDKDYSAYEDEISLKKVYDAFGKNDIPIKTSSVILLNVALNEKNLSFQNLIKMLRDEFTFGHKGLNTYLSTRIRHGVLPNTIRTCVSKENLVTPIDTIKQTPKTNDYWRDNLLHIASREWEDIDKALKKFTIEFDKIIMEINDEWLQIVSLDQDIENIKRGGSKQKALFNYSVSNVESYGLQKLLKDKEYENFIRIISQWIWNKTENNLNAVKKEIKTTAKDRFSECFSILSEDINKAVTKQEEISQLHDAISRSKDSLFTALNIVSSWFTRSKTDDIEEFEFSTAIEIAQRPANIKVNYSNTTVMSLPFNGKHLNSFVDILYILFENAATKSNLNKDELNVDVSLKIEDNGGLSLKITNNCKYIDNIDYYNNQLDHYRKHYGNDVFLNKVVQQEGGTGIFKIWKILSKDIEVMHNIDFGYKSDSFFDMNILILNSSGVLYHENTTS